MTSGPRFSTRHRLVVGAGLVSAVLTGALLSPTIAFADPCQQGGSPDSFGCNPSTGGNSGGGGGGDNSGGGGGDGLSGEIPEDTGQNAGGFDGQEADDPPQIPVPSTAELAESARSSAKLPTPTVHTAPDGKTYVRVKTALWVEGFVTVKTPAAKAGDQSVVATATPKSVTWNLGDATVTCNDAGRPNSTSCSHAYKRSSAGRPGGAFRITATITWGVTWTCRGSQCDSPSGALADMTMTSQPDPLIVGEIQTGTRQ